MLDLSFQYCEIIFHSTFLLFYFLFEGVDIFIFVLEQE